MEQSESGAPVYRHKERERNFEFAVGDSENIDKITEHIEAHIGPVATVFHELISDMVHIDIHIVAPRPERNFYTLVTSGMSDRAMIAPDEYKDFRYAELMLCLPPHWQMSQDAWSNEANYWPIRMLKFLSRFPHEYQTWLWSMHTIPNGNPPKPFASNTQMTGVILLPPITVPFEFHQLEIDAEKTIHFHGIVPLHSDEMDLKLQQGTDALFDGFEKQKVSELLNPSRPSIIAKKRSWFPFLEKAEIFPPRIPIPQSKLVARILSMTMVN